jgi:hypothetical protein
MMYYVLTNNAIFTHERINDFFPLFFFLFLSGGGNKSHYKKIREHVVSNGHVFLGRATLPRWRFHARTWRRRRHASSVSSGNPRGVLCLVDRVRALGRTKARDTFSPNVERSRRARRSVQTDREIRTARQTHQSGDERDEKVDVLPE